MRVLSYPQILKTVLFVLYTSGLFSLPVEDSRKGCFFLKTILNAMITVCCWVSLLVYSVGQLSFAILGNDSSLYLASHSVGSILLLIAFRGCCQKSFAAFCEKFESYHRDHSRPNTNYKSVLVFAILAVADMLGHLGLSGYSLLSPVLVLQCREFYAVLPQIVGSVVCHPVSFGVVVFFVTQPLGASFFFYLSVWRILKIEANGVVEDLTKSDKELLRKAPEVLEGFRLRHADLCHVINAANRFLCHILATFYGVGISCLLLCVHGFTSHSRANLATLENIIIFVIIVVYLVIVTLTAVSLNLKMHEPVDFLFRLDVQRMTGKGSEIVSTFLSRVQGSPIGFNVYNLFTVDTSTIMMICGTILTYTLVIVQFQPVQLATSSPTEKTPEMTSASTHQQSYVNTTGM